MMNSGGKDEFGELSSEESHSEDDEDGWKLTEDVEKEFYKTLSKIKNRDPKIYEKNVEFFKDIPCTEDKPKSKASNPLTLREYERKIIVEKGGELSDEEPSLKKCCKQKPAQPTYVEEQESLKHAFKAVVNSDSGDEDSEEWGGLFKKREKTNKEKDTEEETYKEWLKGQKSSAPDENIEKDMKSLRDYWADPTLNEGDRFLRDYVLNKKFLRNDEEDSNEASEDNLFETPEDVKHENELEVKYSHRFEEPDQEFIKRYPRSMENSVRRKNDHRKQKRTEIKDRKLKEKEKKRAEIKHKKKLKKKEIEDKIQELKKLTGNDQLAFENVLDQDFDLDEHDKAMQRLFNEDFYSQDDPNFKPSEYTASENNEDVWSQEEYGEATEASEVYEPNCEDPDFNMDCDYDPTQKKSKEKNTRSRRRKDKHRRTTVSQAVNQDKPTFDPTMHKSFQEYLDQYYAIDCEDFIGDLACRFKYRRTVPNSYGLTVEEILAADSKELDRWCSIKRIHQLRPDFKERGDVKVYQKKAADEALKRKILPSLFKPFEDEKAVNEGKQDKTSAEISNNDQASVIENVIEKLPQSVNSSNKLSKKINKKLKSTKLEEVSKEESVDLTSRKRKIVDADRTSKSTNKKKKTMEKKKWTNKGHEKQSLKESKKINTSNLKPINKLTGESSLMELSDARLLAYGIKPKKFRNKLKYSHAVS